MTITLAIQCHNFQRRLSWMLSSLLPQRDGLTVQVDAVEGNGEPTTEYLAAYFQRAGLNVQLTTWPDIHEFERRGLVRSAQIQRATSSHILFADSDMVYAPEFFPRLFSVCDSEYAGMYISGRMSQESPEYASQLIASVGPRLPVPHPFEAAASLPLVRRGCVGAGFFQLVRVDACGGYYVTEAECADWRWTGRGQKANSDKQFRHRIGDTKALGRWFSENQIHLNHERDNQAGRHLETQR